MMGLAWIGWIITTVMIGYIFVVLASLWSQGQSIEWKKPLKDVVHASKSNNVENAVEDKEAVV